MGTPFLSSEPPSPPDETYLVPDPVFAMRRAKIQTQLFCLQQAVPPKRHRAAADAGKHVGVLLALATGDRSGISEETWGLLRRTGTAHLLAFRDFLDW